MSRLILFDIDGTLIGSGGAGARSIVRAFQHLYGIENAMKGVDPNGNTDPRIFREALEKNSPIPRDFEQEYPRILQKYLEYLEEEVLKAPNAHIKPGILELLETLSTTPGVFLGLATGNVERGARIKLQVHDLNRFFPIGGFGDDSEIRQDLTRIAVEKAEKLYGQTFKGRDVFIIGDTPRDIDCGRALEGVCIAVATGSISRDELLACSPDYCFEDLRNYQALLDLILG
jgi:phosphoglycolate phosphatase-like HAD superfamily hydrolase